ISTIFLSLSLSLWRHFWTHSVAPTGRPNGAVLIKGLFVFTKQQRSGPTPGPFPSLLLIHVLGGSSRAERSRAAWDTQTHTHRNANRHAYTDTHTDTDTHTHTHAN